MINRSIMALVLLSSTAGAGAQYRLVPGHVDSEGFPKEAALICLGSSDSNHCYTPPDYQANAFFGLDPKATPIGKLNGKELTLFTAKYAASGNVEATSYALLVERGGDFVNLLPRFYLTNQSDFAVWNLDEFSPLPILVTADFATDPFHQIGSRDEPSAHFGRHQYKIRVLTWDPAAEKYTQTLEYTTEHTYSGLDSLDRIKVIEPERKKILILLRKPALPQK